MNVACIYEIAGAIASFYAEFICYQSRHRIHVNISYFTTIESSSIPGVLS